MQFIQIKHVKKIKKSFFPNIKKTMYQKTATVTFPKKQTYVLTHSRQFLSHPDPCSTYKKQVSNDTNPTPLCVFVF
mgnify:CR=1 FL=1